MAFNISNARITRFLMQGQRLPVFLGVVITLILTWLSLAPSRGFDSLISRLDNLIYDQRLNIMPKPERNMNFNIVVVDIDEKSLQAEGHWPWDRFKIGRLIETLDKYGALVTGFDINFPEAQRNAVDDVLSRLGDEQISAEAAQQLRAVQDALDANEYMAQAIANTAMDVALAISFNPVEDVQYGMLPDPIVGIDEEIIDSLTLHNMRGFSANIPVLQEATERFGVMSAGTMNQMPDEDGVVRRVPLVVRYGGALYPTLSLEMVRLFYYEDYFELLTESIGNIERVSGIRIGPSGTRYNIATDERAQVIVPYVGSSWLSGEGKYPYVSATDVLNERVDPSVFENALVLVGTTSTGMFDLRSTPVGAVYPGVEVHANMLNAILDTLEVPEVDSGSQTDNASVLSGLSRENAPRFPYKPSWEQFAIFTTILSLGLILSVLMPFLGPLWLSLTGISFLVAAVWSNFMLWSVYKLDISLTLLLMLIVLLTVANMAYGFLSERMSRETIKGMFDQYVPPAHIDAMLENPDSYSFDGESRELSVLFSDIRDFTTISESLSATELKTLLNEFFTPVTGIIFDHQGTIDKYVGDMVMAFWGAPLDDPEHRVHAVSAALEMLDKVEELKAQFAEKGFPEVNIGVGINTGLMNVGDMGSVYRRSYTVLGDAVNLGSRLEGLTKFYGIKLLIGENTEKELSGYVCRLIDKVKVKGKDTAIKAYEPLCRESEASEELLARVAAYHKALDCYLAQQWDEAERAFKELLTQEPETKLYTVYLERIATLREEVLPQDWDGAFTHTSK
ncbi:MAG: adenylate/guanylate cyclase domain-containing protein [Pseudohongiellaceae bacterium]|nr:adenylate/guanylate cyclase domain-containing protein [Pseudohongiellaceae bacterium]